MRTYPGFLGIWSAHSGRIWWLSWWFQFLPNTDSIPSTQGCRKWTPCLVGFFPKGMKIQKPRCRGVWGGGRYSLVSQFRLEPLSYLMESHEEAVDVISGRAGIERVLVFLYLFRRKPSHLLKFIEHFLMSARQPFHQPREHVVHLRKGGQRMCRYLSDISLGLFKMFECWHLRSIFTSHLSTCTAAKLYGFWDYAQKAEELLVIVAEALPEHQAADHIWNSAAQEEGGIKSLACKKGNTI